MADIIEQVTNFLAPILDGTDMFLVHIKVKPTNNIKVYLDADDGLSIEKIAAVNRKLHTLIEEAEIFPTGDYSLEVSSPGVDEPLILDRQYKKNVGRKVAVTLADDTEKTGLLQEVTDTHLVLAVQGPKKHLTTMVEIPLSDIKKTVVQVIF